ncbi:exodeoxyribonuclease VII large subunit [Halospina denitrificans]|uniref:Exodeoxyribonuclease 7 large subunit n=1 Tax=Halospina denitrificans TaxID=332522 RepID=A0A4R7JX11_9GAMM|nr:exodeoxyribonuclease VII large subunit [Halospina denitrificans]TDT42981.1 exodeoxyribonuclease VII large subunit [Halospina denitrificans]
MRKEGNPPTSAAHAVSVSELTHQVRHLLEVSFLQVWVEGEISGLSRPASGHWYFTLKDDRAQVRCAMFRSRNRSVKTVPAEGEQILVRAKVSLYEARGDFQLIAEAIEPAGLGALQKAFEELKARLDREGLFSEDRKRPIPVPPQRLGLVTSGTGAAIHDILTVLNRRFPGLPVTLYPTPVQGKEATARIVEAIERANRDGRCDALIVGRGGGSLEDLWCFNEEAVARAIHDSRIPIISAVGHEVDITIADLVADQRAPTPSAAAEMVSPDRQKWLDMLTRLEERLLLSARQILRQRHDRVQELGARLRHPSQQLQEQAQRVDDLELRLEQRMQQQLTARWEKLEQFRNRLHASRPDYRIGQYQQRVSDLGERLSLSINTRLRRERERYRGLASQLDLVSPLATLERGYAIAEKPGGDILRDPESINPGDPLRLRLAHGALQCTVDSVEKTSANAPEKG